MNEVLCKLLGHKWEPVYDEWDTQETEFNLGHYEIKVYRCERCGEKKRVRHYVSFHPVTYIEEWRVFKYE